MTGRMVLLRHELTDGSWHYDWMLERPVDVPPPTTSASDQRRLLTFRITARPDLLPPSLASIPAQRLPDHRAAYLDYEGDISGGRGRVTRIAAGRCTLNNEPARSGGYLITMTWDPARAAPAPERHAPLSQRWSARPLPAPVPPGPPVGESHEFWEFCLERAGESGILDKQDA